ncbi:deoxyribonucleotide triphosphate pyrophosphatase [Bacteroidetes bacterium UKL13-3]|jgi:XTP/dITP diphosphohydrolase|nr:deoxyribonucleotide triphosphate pyrophosphatase [Bacteroidetes bacterium UKL13-3]HCP94128.1 non-canonical purine NTP pyrophosphatase [Bacteroidota bacterium]
MEKVLVFATHNKNKVFEVQQLLGDGFEIRTLSDIACHDEIEETGLTLSENASIKSSFVFNKYGLSCFADDTGLEVSALNGAPGVFSARYAGVQKSDNDNINLLLHNLKGNSNREARFKTVISCILDGKETFFEGILEGQIVSEKVGENGFGYDPIFKPNNYNITLAQMTIDEKNKISHRAKATLKFIEFLRQMA